MEKKVFNNDFFSKWLSQKTDEIIGKVDREKITTEEMMILSLKAQTNHFSHLDDEFRGEFKAVRRELKEETAAIRQELKEETAAIRLELKTETEAIRQELKEETSAIRQEMDKRFDLVDKRFDRLTNFFMWQTGVFVTLFIALGTLIYTK